MGKTALALNMAVNVAKREIPVLIFSLEMDDEQIGGDRIVLSELLHANRARKMRYHLMNIKRGSATSSFC